MSINTDIIEAWDVWEHMEKGTAEYERQSLMIDKLIEAKDNGEESMSWRDHIGINVMTSATVSVALTISATLEAEAAGRRAKEAQEHAEKEQKAVRNLSQVFFDYHETKVEHDEKLKRLNRKNPSV